jgi:hypothetical protein
MKIRLLGTDIMRLVGACRSFTKTPKKNLCQTMQEQSIIYGPHVQIVAFQDPSVLNRVTTTLVTCSTSMALSKIYNLNLFPFTAYCTPTNALIVYHILF